MKEDPTYEELRSANLQLKQKVEWLEGVYHTHKDAGIQVKSRFLSNISHEIRTPMNAILGFSDLLKNSTLTTIEREEYIHYISHNSQALLKVMDNLMDLTLLETDNLKMRQEEVFVEELFREIYEHYNSKVVQTLHYKIALLMTIPTVYGRVTVTADGYRLRRILDNLVTTAIAHQKKGVIEMKMDIVDEKSVQFSIISMKNDLLEERAKMVFENNGNTDDWHNHIDATGLAFKLTRDLANAMGGSVSIVKVDKKRIGICLELPITKIGNNNKSESNKDVTALLN
jgi:signal transduction histidine kinase